MKIAAAGTETAVVAAISVGQKTDFRFRMINGAETEYNGKKRGNPLMKDTHIITYT